MFLTHITKFRKVGDGDHGELFEGYRYYRLSEAYRNKDGKPRNRVVIGLGELTGYSKEERQELATVLEYMIVRHELCLCSSEKVRNQAVELYSRYLQKQQEEEKPKTASSQPLAEKVQEHSDSAARKKIGPLLLKNARTVGAENICMDTARRLGIHTYLMDHGFSRKQADMALMQIVARAVYPGSELRTVRCLKENSALCELVGIKPERINKDALYRSAGKLWDIHSDMEDYLHRRVVSMFDLEEKIYLFDLTNTYFEGRMEGSELAEFGRSKERRTDCRIVVLAAVVNTDGLLVRSAIFEGNRQDVTTLEDVIGSLEQPSDSSRRKVIVMDAGFCSESNLQWLRDNGYDYITVMRSTGRKYTPASDVIEKVSDNKKQTIRLQKVAIKDCQDEVLLVDSDAKTLKERSMLDKSIKRAEESLAAIAKGIEGRGTKNRDALQRRLGRLQGKYPALYKAFDIQIEYDKKDCATGMTYKRNEEYLSEKVAMHGKYLLRTTLTELSEEKIWMFYNVIRTVEETFKTLKSDLDIRPVFHKSDDGAKAHLNLAILAYWIVSVTQYRLRQKGVNMRWSEVLRIMSSQVRVTAEYKTVQGNCIAVRRSTEQESTHDTIYNALDIKTRNVVTLKSVVHPIPPPENAPAENQ